MTSLTQLIRTTLESSYGTGKDITYLLRRWREDNPTDFRRYKLHSRAYWLAGGGAGSPFIVDTTNLTGWYDGSDLATITETGGQVSAIADKSPGGRDLVLAGTNPQTGVTTQNSLDVLTFGAGDCLDWSIAGGGGVVDSNMTLYSVFKALGGSTYDAAPCVLTAGSNGRPMDRFDSNWVHGITAITPSTGAFVDMGAQTTWCVMSWTAEKDAIAVGTHRYTEYKNGVMTGQGQLTTTWNNAAVNIGLGQRQDGVTQFRGDWGETLIYDAAHDTATREGIEGYLAAKFGVTF